MKLNPRKTLNYYQSFLDTGEPDLEVSSFLKLLGITIDDKLTIEKHIRNIASSIV